VKSKILKCLDRIEKEHEVKIILACESGSRAWGFPSKDSDYDVRFIYAHQRDWYLSIGEKRDVIELPIDDELDINGWDLRKALGLLRKSNSPLLEWLSSPIRYRFVGVVTDALIKVSKMAFMPKTSFYHYLSMTKNSISKFQNGKKEKIKTYLYALRTILCCKWIIKYLNQPPMLIDNLISELLTDNNLREDIERLIRVKKENSEKFLIQRSPIIEDYLCSQLRILQNQIPKDPPKVNIDRFDSVFREILDKLRAC